MVPPDDPLAAPPTADATVPEVEESSVVPPVALLLPQALAMIIKFRSANVLKGILIFFITSPMFLPMLTNVHLNGKCLFFDTFMIEIVAPSFRKAGIVPNEFFNKYNNSYVWYVANSGHTVAVFN